VQAFYRPIVLQEVEAPIFLDTWNIKVVLSLASAAFIPQEISPALISVIGSVDPRAIARPED